MSHLSLFANYNWYNYNQTVNAKFRLIQFCRSCYVEQYVVLNIDFIGNIFY